MIALPPLAARYEHFRQDVFGGLDESLPLKGWQEPMTELQLQSLWFAGQFGPDFTSTDGKRVHVRDFGVWNLGAGPDFNGVTPVKAAGQSSDSGSSAPGDATKTAADEVCS